MAMINKNYLTGGYSMKKLKVLGALLVAATVALGSFSVVLADGTFDDLEVSTRNFFNIRGAYVGTFPVIEGFDDLNERILRDLEAAFDLATDSFFTTSIGPTNVFNVSFEVTDHGQFGRIEVTYIYHLTAHRMAGFTESRTYFVDKELGEEITEAEFDAGIAAAEAAAEEAAAEEAAAEEEPEVVEEIEPEIEIIDELNEDDDDIEEINDDAVEEEVIMVPIRLHAEALGYEVDWDGDTRSVILTRGEDTFTITVDVNQYPVGGDIVALELAPVNQNGSVFVPVSFFVQVLGAEFSVDAAGNVSFSDAGAVEADDAEDVEEDDYEDE